MNKDIIMRVAEVLEKKMRGAKGALVSVKPRHIREAPRRASVVLKKAAEAGLLRPAGGKYIIDRKSPLWKKDAKTIATMLYNLRTSRTSKKNGR